MEDYKKIIGAFSSGQVQSIEELGNVPEHIETMISHLFLFPETVYKISKRDNTFFNEHFRNLSDRKARIDFYKSDFFENNYFSPDVYLNLFGLSVTDKGVAKTSNLDEANDVVMKMKRIDLEFNLSNLLHKKAITKEDCRSMGFQQTKAVAHFPKQPRSTESYYDIFQRRLDDLRDWLYSAPHYFSKGETDNIVGILRGYLEREKEDFTSFNTSDYVVSLDNHSDNIFYKDGRMFFLDIYPPKEDWMIVSPLTNIYRPATDIFILLGEEYARAFLQGYKDFYGHLSEKHELFYLIYSAGIQAVSLHNLSSTNDLKRQDSVIYKDFIERNIGELR